MEVTCWNCSNGLKVDSVDYNEVLECPHCEKNFTIRKTKMDRLFFWQIPDSYGNGYERITSIPIDQYISEIFEHKRLESLEYLTSGSRGNHPVFLIVWGIGTLGIVILFALIMHLSTSRPRPPLIGYKAKAYIDSEIQHLVITEPRGGAIIPIDLIPIDKLRMKYIPSSGSGDDYVAKTAAFYYGNVSVGEFPNSQKNVDKINAQISRAVN